MQIDTEWMGPAPPLDVHPRVRSRAACDLEPLDLRSPEERLRLRAYIWADQADRLARFDAAATLAVAHDVRVERADAAAWLEERLAHRAVDALTVVYHSVFYSTRRRRRASELPPRSSRRGAQHRRRSRGCGSSPRPCSADRERACDC